MQLATAADEVSSAARDFSIARAERDAAQDEQRRLRANLQKVCVLAMAQVLPSKECLTRDLPSFCRTRTVCSQGWQALWLRQVACWCRRVRSSIPAATLH